MAEGTKNLLGYWYSSPANWDANWDADDEHIEIESHRIECVIPGVIQYNILPKDKKEWIRGFGLNCGEQHIEEVTRLFRSFSGSGQWTEPRNSKLLRPALPSSPRPSTVFLPASNGRPSQDAQVGDWVQQPESLLERLEDDSYSEKDRLAAVLFAETKPFDGELLPRFLSALRRFIECNRLTDDPDRMIYLCSAIRKYAMNMEQKQIDAYVEWILPTDTTPVHHEIEMEFVKGLSYRLQFEKLRLHDESAKAIEILGDLSFGYLRRSLILQKSYANTAMLAIVCIAILESLSESQTVLTIDILKRIKSLGILWFQEMVNDNLSEAVEFVEANNPTIAVKLRSLLGSK